MKKVLQYSLHGLSAKSMHGWAVKVGVVVLGAALYFSTPATVIAASSANVSQLQYLQWMAQLCGDSAQFSADSSEADYQQWARTKNMNPTGGWKNGTILTRDALAQTLVQLYGLTPKKWQNNYSILEREGIDIPDGNLVSRTSLVSLVDEFGFQSRTAIEAKKKKSKHKSSDKDTKPPKPKHTSTDKDKNKNVKTKNR